MQEKAGGSLEIVSSNSLSSKVPFALFFLDYSEHCLQHLYESTITEKGAVFGCKVNK